MSRGARQTLGENTSCDHSSGGARVHPRRARLGPQFGSGPSDNPEVTLYAYPGGRREVRGTKSATKNGTVGLVSLSSSRTAAIFRGEDLEFLLGHGSQAGGGISLSEYAGARNRSVHLSVSLVDFEPGATVR